MVVFGRLLVRPSKALGTDSFCHLLVTDPQMLRIVQHVRLARPPSICLAGRLVRRDTRFSSGVANDVPTTMGVGAGVLSGRQTTVLVSSPRRENLDPEEELLEDSEARFQISERAAEVCTARHIVYDVTSAFARGHSHKF